MCQCCRITSLTLQKCLINASISAETVRLNSLSAGPLISFLSFFWFWWHIFFANKKWREKERRGRNVVTFSICSGASLIWAKKQWRGDKSCFHICATLLWKHWHTVRYSVSRHRCQTLLSNRPFPPEYIILINYTRSPLNLNDLQRSVPSPSHVTSCAVPDFYRAS